MAKFVIALIVMVITAFGSTDAGSPEWDTLKAKWSLPTAFPRLPTNFAKVAAKTVISKVSSKAADFFENSWNTMSAIPAHLINTVVPKFIQLPRTVNEIDKMAKSKSKWERIDNACQHDNFLGYRYVYKTLNDPKDENPNKNLDRHGYNIDPTIILLMDGNGNIVGIQSAVNDPHFVPADPLKNVYYVESQIGQKKYWTQTVYFVDPIVICGVGRQPPAEKGTGDGNGLWIPKGPVSAWEFLQIPMDEEKVKSLNWGSGKCFPTMGQHYWYGITETMSCNNFVPYFLLYNKHRLTGFGLIKNTLSPESNYFDSPSPSNNVFKTFMEPVPKCFFEDKSYEKLRTIHFYLNSKAEYRSTC